MRTQSKTNQTAWSAGKRERPCGDWFNFCTWLVERVARVFWSLRLTYEVAGMRHVRYRPFSLAIKFVVIGELIHRVSLRLKRPLDSYSTRLSKLSWFDSITYYSSLFKFHENCQERKRKQKEKENFTLPFWEKIGSLFRFLLFVSDIKFK